VKEAVLRALPQVWHPAATHLTLDALRDHDPGVLASACEALAAIARRTPTADAVPPPLASDRAVRSLRRAGSAIPDIELETLTMWIDAVDATDSRALLPRVRTLALHPSYAVRHRARLLLTRWEQPLPRGALAAQSNPIRAAEVPAPSPRTRVQIRTSRGPLVLELRPDAAPTTVARFLGLVRRHFYDGLTFHRVVPGFVVQGGDPRGDGYGGAGFWQRCEDNRLPYVRGTVGMALAGRDSGGSQFFITYSRQPHLDGKYTAFGQVVEGLDRLDMIQQGDRIEAITIVSP
jgi:cyclophilin family peptidyl-prolyl cis-trans isomerase